MLPGRHRACRWREAQPGSCTEPENLAGDAKGKCASGDHREAVALPIADLTCDDERLLVVSDGLLNLAQIGIGEAEIDESIGLIPPVAGLA